jgi:hypothetical protein
MSPAGRTHPGSAPVRAAARAAAQATARATVIVAASCAALGAWAGSASAQSVVWDGDAGDADWFTPDNWSSDEVPEAGDDVIANADQVINAAGDIEVGSLLAQGPGLSVVAGLFSVAGSAEINNFTIDNCCFVDFITGGTMTFTGDSTFVERPVFVGGTYRFNDDTRFLEGFVAAAQTEFRGTARLATGASGVADGINADIQGTIELEPASVLTVVDQGGWAVFGTVRAVEPKGPDSPNPASFNGTASVFGGFEADTRRLDVNAAFTMFGGQIRVENGGLISVRPVDFSTLSNTAISGEGTVDLASTFLRIDDLGGPVTSSVTAGSGGQGLRLRSDLNITAGARLESSGDLVLGPGDLEGEGTLVVAGGAATVTNGFANNGQLEVSGGTLTIDRVVSGTTGRYRSIGGTIQLRSGAGLNGDGSQSFVGLEVVSGTVEIPASEPDSAIVVIDTPYIQSGGTLRVRKGEMQFRDQATLNGGTIDFGQTAGDTLPSAGFFGSFAETVFVAGGPGVQGRGRLFLGGGFSGVRPEVRVQSGSWTVGLGSDDDRDAYLRLRTTLTGDAPLINTGYMIIDGVPVIQGQLVNSGTATLSGQLRVEGSLVNAGVFEQNNTVFFPDGAPGAVVNNSLWRVGPNGGFINGALGSVTNTGVYEVAGPGPGRIGHSIVANFSNIGTLTATNANVNIFQSPQILESGRIIGGSWIAGDNASIRLPFDVSVIAGTGTRIEGDTDALPEARDIDRVEDGAEVFATGGDWDAGGEDVIILNGGRFIAGRGLVVTEGLETDDGGSINVAPGATLDASGPVRVGAEPDGLPSVIDQLEGVLEIRRGSGSAAVPSGPDPVSTLIAPSLELWGRLVPGGDDTVGVFDLQTDVTARPSATLEFDVLDAQPAGVGTDRVDISGAVELAGTLRLKTAADFNGPAGTSWTILTAGAGVIGSFDAVERVGPNAAALRVQVNANEVVVTVGCAADYDQDGQVNILDVIAFIAVWGALEPGADYNGDSSINILDVVAFVGDWQNGCPAPRP